MSEEEKPTPMAIRDYSLLAVASLMVLTVALVQLDYGAWSLLPVVPGLFAVLTGWSLGPAAVLLLLTFLFVAGNPFRGAPRDFAPMPQVEDMAVAASVLVFIAAQLRLASLTNGALPGDRRRKERVATARARGRWLAPEGRTKRTPDRVAISEFVVLLGMAGLFAFAGYLLAMRVQLDIAPDVLKMPDDRIWRVLLVAWTMGLAIAGGKAVASALGWQAAGRDEAATYLQDQLWAGTRGEQRRMQRWAMKGRLQREKREGG